MGVEERQAELREVMPREPSQAYLWIRIRIEENEARMRRDTLNVHIYVRDLAALYSLAADVVKALVLYV